MTKIRSKIGVFLELGDQQAILPQNNKQLLVIVKKVQGTPDALSILYELLTEVWGHQAAMSIYDKVRYKLYPISEEDDKRRYILIIFLTGEEISLNGIQYHNNPLVEMQKYELSTLIKDSSIRCDTLHRKFIETYLNITFESN